MKAARHAMILQLIEHSDIETQEDLAEQLKKSGHKVTQATVSRDIKEIRLIKVLAESGKYKYATIDKAESGFIDKFMHMFSQSVVNIIPAGNIIVLKTISSSANVVAEAIDSLRWKEIAGTIAGDNTVFCAITDIDYVSDVIVRFRSILN